MSIQFKRGTSAERLTVTPKLGEPFYDITTSSLYMGDGSTVGGTTSSSTVSTLSSLTDVSIAGASSGDFLIYNGSDYINQSNINSTSMISSTTGIAQPEISGWVRGDNISVNLRPVPKAVTPTVTLMSDDGYVSDYTTIIPWALASGVPMSFSLHTNDLYKGGSYMTWAQIEAAHSSGMDFVSHGDANNPKLEDITTHTGMMLWIRESQLTLQEHGIYTDCYVNPQHSTSEMTRRYQSRYYRAARSNNPPNTSAYNDFVHDQYRLTSSGLVEVGFDVTQASVDAAKAICDDMMANSGNNCWAIFYVHGANNDTVTSGLAAVANYASGIGCELLNMSDAAKKHSPYYLGGDLEKEGFGVSPLGHLRSNQLDVLDEIRIRNSDYPFKDTYVRIRNDTNNLKLSPYSSSDNVVIQDADAIFNNSVNPEDFC